MAVASELSPEASRGATGWLASRWERLTGPARLAGIDLARGLAVLGMLAAHLIMLPEWRLADPATLPGLVHGRSSILFAMLAGVSIGLVTGGTAPLSGPSARVVRLRLVLRAIVLWMLGLLLIATGVPVYVILPAYAILFLLALPLTRLTARTLLPLAGVLALTMPFAQVLLDDLPIWSTRGGALLAAWIGWHYPFPVWIAYVVCGLGIARLGLRRLRVQVGLVAAGAVLAVIGYGLDALAPAVGRVGAEGIGLEAPTVAERAWTAVSHSNGLLEVVGSGGFALAVIGACLLLARTPLSLVLLPLRAVGAMPLTAYTAQLVVWAVWAGVVLGRTSDLFGFQALHPFPAMVCGLLVACTAWALLIGRGPLEAAVDGLARLVVPRR